jgi:hypothetical protein
MPNRDDDEPRTGRPLLKVLFWAGVAIAPVAMALLLLADGNGPLRIAAVLAILSVVLIGLSVALRGDPETVRVDLEDALAEEIDNLHKDVRKDIASAARQTHQAFGEKLQAVQQQLEVLRGQLDGMRGAPARPGFDPARPAFEPTRPAFEPARSGFEPGWSGFEPARSAFEPARAAYEPAPAYVPPAASHVPPAASHVPPAAAPTYAAIPAQYTPSSANHYSGGQYAGAQPGGGDRHAAPYVSGAASERHAAAPEPRRGAGVVHTETFQVTTSRHTYVGERGAEPSGNVYGGDQSGNVYGAESFAAEPSGSVYGGGRYSPEPAEESWTDQRLREMRVGERRASVYADGGGEMHVQDRWASVRQEEPRSAADRYDDWNNGNHSWGESTAWPAPTGTSAPALPQRSAEPTWQPESSSWTAEPAAAWGNGWGEPEPVYDAADMPRAGRRAAESSDERWNDR